MSEFKSLLVALAVEGAFEKEWMQLADVARSLIERELPLIGGSHALPQPLDPLFRPGSLPDFQLLPRANIWDGLTAQQRWQAAFHRDRERYPSNEADLEREWQLIHEIDRWEGLGATTVSETKEKDDRLAELHRELETVSGRLDDRTSTLTTLAAFQEPSNDRTSEAFDWLCREMQRRKQRGLTYNRPTMEIALGDKYPEFRGRKARAYIQMVPKHLRARAGRRSVSTKPVRNPRQK